uniref:Zinc finger SWIM domain-containing protein 6 n=1 Tax=Aceria tosichella TaxID=561515 RepID=A0A6G1S7I8_9ACAR
MDPSSSHHHHHNQAHPNPLHSHLHTLCSNHSISTNSNSSNLANVPLIGGATGLPSSLPLQLSQSCSNQQYPLLALQRNFSHLLPLNFPDPLQFDSSHYQAPQETRYRNQRGISTNHYNHHHHLHHRHHNHEHNHAPHHQRGHHNWRKSKLQVNSKPVDVTPNGEPLSLLDLSAKIVAEHIPFQSIEQKYQHIPEPVQRRIIFWSFPRHEDDIKMYSSLSSDTFNSNAPTSSSTNTTSNATTQSPSSNSTIWVDQSSTQGNTASNQAHSAKQNAKQLTFHKGLRLYDEGCVQDALQVGFNLSGSVKMRSPQPVPMSNNSRNRIALNNAISQIQNNEAPTQNQVASVSNDGTAPKGEVQTAKSHRVSVTFDRCKITSVSCSCELQDIFWCEHAVALIIHRIRNPETIDLRVPISETLSNLDRQQLQKLVQYIIAEHHTEVLPTAQRLLDEMRQSFSEINQIQGAPDPTAGACTEDEHIWHLDESQVNEKVQNYLNSVVTNSKEAGKQIQALFEKIREMFRAKDSNGTRLLRLITEQFLLVGTKSEKHRPYWDQLTFLWVVVTLNPDLSRLERRSLLQLLNGWSRQSKCPKEDLERRISIKRKTAEMSDDEDSDDNTPNPYSVDYPMLFSRSNNYPAHMATHRRNFQSQGFPVLRPYNQLAVSSSGCPCQVSHPILKRARTDSQQNSSHTGSSRNYRPSSSSSNHVGQPRVGGSLQNSNENRPSAVQEPRSVFHRAIDFMDISWDDPHLQLILNKDGPLDFDTSKSHLVDFGYPLWHEPISQAAARIETLRSYGYREQALRLTVASIRRLKLQQEQWCIASAPDTESNLPPIALEMDAEGWIGHPFDPINVMVDLLLSASTTEPNNNPEVVPGSNGLCSLNASHCSCPYSQAFVDFTQRLLPDLASLSYQHRSDAFPLMPLGVPSVPARRASSGPNQGSTESKKYYHVPVPGCCQKDSYLTLGFELALIALSQQRPIPTAITAHDRAVRQEADLISRLETIDISDPLLIEILKRQTTLLLEGGPFQNSCCGIPADSTPLHTFAKYLFESLVPYYSPLAFKVGVHALKMPLPFDENGENIGAVRTSPRYTFNQTHLQTEQLTLAQTMLSRAKEEKQFDSFLRKVYRASVKNIRNPNNLHKLSKHALKEAKSISGCQLQQPIFRAVLQTAFDLGLQVLKMTLNPQSTNSKARRDAILFIVECSTDMGLESVIQVMKDARDNFSAIEALSLVVSRDSDPTNNLRTQAITKLKLKDSPQDEARLNRRSRDLALDCAARDPTNCALEAIKFCEVDDDSLKKALKIVIENGSNGAMDSTQLIKVADHIHERGMTDRAFDIAIVAVDGLTSSSNLDNPTAKKDIYSACEYASKVNGFSILIPKLLNIESAYVLSDIYHRFSPQPLIAPAYRNYANDVMASYRDSLNYSKEYNDIISGFNRLNPEIYRQKLEDARWWDALLKRTMKSFVDTTRSKLQNISPRHYGEFIDFLAKAQAIFDKAADGPKQFKDLIAEIVKSYRTKRKLMERLKIRFDTLNIGGKI